MKTCKKIGIVLKFIFDDWKVIFTHTADMFIGHISNRYELCLLIGVVYAIFPFQLHLEQIANFHIEGSVYSTLLFAMPRNLGLVVAFYGARKSLNVWFKQEKEKEVKT